MAIKNKWQSSYLAAATETDWTRMPERITSAESAIAKQQLLLLTDHGGTPIERKAIASALVALNILREEVGQWQQRAGAEPRRADLGS